MAIFVRKTKRIFELNSIMLESRRSFEARNKDILTEGGYSYRLLLGKPSRDLCRKTYDSSSSESPCSSFIFGNTDDASSSSEISDSVVDSPQMFTDS
ncbi:MAG: hypothetical protein A2928_02675 [Candidatus Taylorbacteria bacterium RIFCSPLOWO2_01_FULL_45_15b]|uniref:Uncharacterized protein n=1 Tax=Candidatus Taylorbacteria bacterium RIFCSPLOWO2_01_FULL_45_15b TaxID=1802319 RepID=A0A1G2ND77_9BACT|nr:MAG: hypothetical protein A2928_02675 [Candidatus Taylorbacteria bacterium RIFCSPLOWO2_01_FULL_45_15b]